MMLVEKTAIIIHSGETLLPCQLENQDGKLQSKEPNSHELLEVNPARMNMIGRVSLPDVPFSGSEFRPAGKGTFRSA